MFYFEDTITQFDVSELTDHSVTTDKDKYSVKSEAHAEAETPDSPDDILQRIRQVM